MPDIPNAHPGAPLTLWLRCSRTTERWYQSTLDRPPLPDAVEYVRKDVCDAWLTEAARLGSESAADLLQAAVKRRRSSEPKAP